MADIEILNKPSITPSYVDLTYSKGPRQNYFLSTQGDTWINLSLNRAQEDEDDEWGRTETIALRSIIDNVTAIWQTLWGLDGTQDASIDSVIGSLNGILGVISLDPVVSESSITIGDTVLDSNGLTVGSSSFQNTELYLDSGIRLTAGNTQTKYFRFHDSSYFYMGFNLASGLGTLSISIPAGGTSSVVHNFTSTGITFDHNISLDTGSLYATYINSSSIINAATYITVQDGNAYIDSSTIGIGATGDQIVLSLASGFFITCSGARRVEIQIGGTSWLKFFSSSSIEGMWVQSGASPNNRLGLRGGANLWFLSTGTPYDDVDSASQIRAQIGADTGYFGVYSTAIATSIRLSVPTTGPRIDFYRTGSQFGYIATNTTSSLLSIYNVVGGITLSSATSLDLIVQGNITAQMQAAASIFYIHSGTIATSIRFSTGPVNPTVSFYNSGTSIGGISASTTQFVMTSSTTLVISSGELQATSTGDISITAAGSITLTGPTGITLNSSDLQKINITNLPNSPSGLDPGDLWVDFGTFGVTGTIRIVL